MKLAKFYEYVVKFGIQADPRPKSAIKRQLAETKKSYRKLSAPEKHLFDKESFSNPYADTRLLYGSKNRQIRRIMVGIDVDAGELLLADRLRQKGQKIDLVISHHPRGTALAGFFDVMRMQTDLLVHAGLSRDVASDFVNKRIKEVERKVMSSNHQRAVDIAKVLDIPFMCVHTPADNHAAQFIQGLMDKKKPKSLQVILNLLRQVPEYKDAMRQKSGPQILVGDPKSKPGKILAEMTGGTEGPKDLFGRLSQAGVNTIVGMHLSEGHFKRIKPEHINVVIAGHVSSDSLGMNLILDKIGKMQKFDFVSCSGFARFRR